MSHAFSRRTLLKGLGAGLALSPLGFPRDVMAATALPKLLVFATPNSWMVGWDGMGSGKPGWGLPGVSEMGSNIQAVDLPSQLPSILAPLQAFGNRLVVIDNLSGIHGQKLPADIKAVNPHQNAAYILTGTGVFNDEPADASGGDGEWYSKGISIDQRIAERWGTKVLGMSYGIEGANLGEGVISHLGPNKPFVPIQNPADAFQAVFGVDQTDPVAVAAAERRAAVLQLLERDANGMASRLTSRDRARLLEHAQAVASVQDGIANVGIGCESASPVYDYDATDAANIPRLMRDYSDIMASALACGATRIGLVQAGNLGGQMKTQWPEYGLTDKVSDHSWNHAFAGKIDRGDTEGKYTQAQAWNHAYKLALAYSEMFAYLLARLDAVEDVDGNSVLHNTVVLHVKQMRTNHYSKRHMVMMAGGQGLGVRGGRFIRARGVKDPSSPSQCQWLNDLHVGIAHQLGLTDIQSHGYAALNQEPVDLS